MVEKARLILEKAHDEKREITKAEKEDWTQIHDDADSLTVKIIQEEREAEVKMKGAIREIRRAENRDAQELSQDAILGGDETFESRARLRARR